MIFIGIDELAFNTDIRVYATVTIVTAMQWGKTTRENKTKSKDKE